MTETQKRIKAYRAALPGLKERVAAVALLLAMSVVMMTSATFAWLTISRRPEVTGVNTTVAANGNLEIALATGDGKTAPGESKVGDSSANEDQSVIGANITWGNLVNLSDPSYGLENLTMRPAQLNTASLLDSPLYGAMYGQDGRITQLSSNFSYTTWNVPEGDKPGFFGVSEAKGVRAISSTKIEAVGAEAKYVNMLTNARDTNLAAANMYTALGSNGQYMPSLATMMGLYMTARMNPDDASLSNPTCEIKDIQNLRDMYGAFLDCFDAEAEAIAALVNLQLFLLTGEGNYTPYTGEMVYGTTTAKLASGGIQVSDLDQFIKDRNTVASDYLKLVEMCTAGTSLKWKDSGLNGIVNNLVDVGKCTIGADNTPISSIGASNAMGYLSGTQEARITNGILYRFEERTGGYIEVKNLSISATVKRLGITIPASVKANVQTTAPRDYNLFANDLTYAESLNDGTYEGGIPVAEDTYGLALDLWVRTNAENSYLTLEGNVITEEGMPEPVVGRDANGNEVNLYTVTVVTETEDGGTVEFDLDLYKIETEDDAGIVTTKWYNAETYVEVTAEEMNGQEPVAKMVTPVYVVGYEGENRVWQDGAMLSADATTQGSGSCYVYYADTPEDQARSLELLKAFNVAFVSAEGKQIGAAIMDTERFYASNGRVIVPLKLDPSKSINLGEDYEGNINYAITNLEKNVPTRITAIVYLDGTQLTNDQVLAAADIQGQLNIQFGSSQTMEPIDNEELANKERRVSASVDKTSFDYDTATDPITVNVTVHVDGDTPSTVTAFFLRAINATQGSREEKMTFTNSGGGDWTASYTFDSPGNYILRTVQLDGVDYDLSEPPTVSVAGFALESLSCAQATENHLRVMTAAQSTSVDLRLKFATNDASKMPGKVQARYLREDGSAVNIDLTVDSNQIWTGRGTFTMSGHYTMEYLVLDGEYVALDEALCQTADITLGMRVEVYTTSPHSFKYLPSEMTENMKNLAMQVLIKDNAGNEMPGLSGVKLTYGMKGSGIKKMDTDLTWNGSYYVGTMSNGGAGIWQFREVTVGDDVLTTATTSPTFTIQSPEPPEYYDFTRAAYQYVPNNDAKMNVQITNSAAATVQAYIIKSGASEGTWVTGTIGNELTTTDGKPANHWNFEIPKDANGYQDGNWQLTALRLWDVFAADGTQYTEEAPLEIDVSNTNNTTKAVSRIYVTFAQGQSRDFGKDESGNVTGTFMQSHTFSGLSVDFKDFENAPVSGVSDVKLEFAYVNGTSKDYGGYTSESLTNATDGAIVTVTLTDPDGDGHFVQTSDAAILFAGKYITEFSYKVSGTTTTTGGTSGNALPGNAPVFTVWSKAPTVTIDSISPSGSHKSMAKSGNNAKAVDVNSSVTGNTVTIYAGKTDPDNGTIDTTPSVTLRINNLGNAQSAKLVFTASGGGTVYMYTSTGMSGRTDTYSWTSGSPTYSLYIGQYKSSRTCQGMTYEGAGTLTSNSTITIVYSNVEYTVNVSPITIINNNPPY